MRIFHTARGNVRHSDGAVNVHEPNLKSAYHIDTGSSERTYLSYSPTCIISSEMKHRFFKTVRNYSHIFPSFLIGTEH